MTSTRTRKYYSVYTQREGHAPREMHTFKSRLKAERARAATEFTLNEFCNGAPWRVWVDEASPTSSYWDTESDHND